MDELIIGTTEIKKCSRCGGDHAEVAVRAFRLPNKGADFWMQCPETGEPILLDLKRKPPGMHEQN